MIKKITAVAALALLMCPLSFAQRSQGTSARFIPEDGKTLVFIGQNNKSADDYVKSIKEIPAGFMVYTSLSDLAGLEGTADFGAGETSAEYILKKYPKAALQIGLYLVNSLDDVISGDLDENILKFGRWIKKTKVPVYLRIGYEFDYPENGYEPEKYVKAFRHIVDKMDSIKVSNVSYVWHSYASEDAFGLDSWYPGDEYVDWCAISYFNNPQWIPMVQFAQKHTKPLMVAESAPMLGETSDQSRLKWYSGFFRFVEMCNVKAIGYINVDWDSLPMFESNKWGSSVLGKSGKIKKLWKQNISGAKYIGYEELYDSVNFDADTTAFIIFCHPDNKNSLNAKILEKTIKTLEENGVRCVLRDLYEMNFNPVMSKSELEEIKNNRFSKEAEKEQTEIKKSDFVIFIYPIWWNGAPAMLKGYIERYFPQGFAFDFKSGASGYAIKYKEAIVFNTMEMSRKAFENSGVQQAFEKIYDELTFNSLGFRVNHKYFWSVSDNQEKLQAVMSAVEEIINSVN